VQRYEKGSKLQRLKETKVLRYLVAKVLSFLNGLSKNQKSTKLIVLFKIFVPVYPCLFEPKILEP
jgi:hypothetical protein